MIPLLAAAALAGSHPICPSTGCAILTVLCPPGPVCYSGSCASVENFPAISVCAAWDGRRYLLLPAPPCPAPDDPKGDSSGRAPPPEPCVHWTARAAP